MDSRKLDLIFLTNYEKGIESNYDELVSQANTKTAKELYEEYKQTIRNKK